MNAPFASAIYRGKVRHRRFSPTQHAFEYDVFMMYLDTQEIEKIFALSRFWSLKHFAPVQFKRSDFHIDEPNKHLTSNLPSVDESVRNTIFSATGIKPTGPIRMLINLRYWGVNMNPLSTYYAFNENNELQFIVAEVNNTPWNEKHSYVLDARELPQKQSLTFTKEFHVSPFNPIDMQYRWQSTTPANHLTIHLENWKESKKVMDATMTLTRQEISSRSMNAIIIQFPWMTVKVISAIYWQALKLWLKGTPLHTHPKVDAANNNKIGQTAIATPSRCPQEENNL